MLLLFLEEVVAKTVSPRTHIIELIYKKGIFYPFFLAHLNKYLTY